MAENQIYNILIIEDDDPCYLYLKATFESERMNIKRALNGLQAIDLVKNSVEKFDIVLMDLKLPGMDGYEITAELKKIHPDLPVILQTATHIEDVLEICNEHKFETIIRKPFYPNELLDTVYSSLKKHKLVKSSFEYLN